MKVRVGFGFDIHQLKEGSNFRLGGITIPHTKGATGHSDADVLIHAICDALLGATGLGDIGFHFPDSLQKYQGIDSKFFLKKVMELIRKKGYVIGNIDCTVCLERPKIAAYIADMKQTLSKTMKVSKEEISIKATTNEKLGYIGREEGVCAYAVVLVSKKN